MLFCETCKTVYFKYPMERYIDDTYLVEVKVEEDEQIKSVYVQPGRRLTLKRTQEGLTYPSCPNELKDIQKTLEGRLLYNYDLSSIRGIVPQHTIRWYNINDYSIEYYLLLKPFIKNYKIELNKL